VHAEWYKTSILGAEELRFDAYHDFMGETRIWQDCNYKLQLAQVTETQMMRALQGLFGQQASFNCPEQKQMVINSCNSHLKHKYDGLRCGYVGLIENRDDISNVEVIQSPDLVGDGLDFEVMRVGGDIIAATIQLADHYVRQNNHAVHVLCASKQHCQQFEAKLNNRDDVVVVHSGTSREEQATAAKAWFTCQAKQLYATSLGTVGNENDELGGIIIVGLLFNLSTLVQIFGRLRPRQRGTHSKVYQLVSDWDLQLNAQVTSTADNIRNDLKNAGHLHADDESTYNEVFHIDGYKRFVSSNDCYFTKLSVLFSDNVSPPCGSHCTWCRHGQRHTLYNYTISNAQQGTTLQMVTPIVCDFFASKSTEKTFLRRLKSLGGVF